jgi:hypothetical protein
MREQDRQVRPLTSTRQEGRAANPVTSIGLHVSPELEIYIETRDARDYNGVEVRRLMACVASYVTGQEKQRVDKLRRRNRPCHTSEIRWANDHGSQALWLVTSQTSSGGDK